MEGLSRSWYDALGAPIRNLSKEIVGHRRRLRWNGKTNTNVARSSPRKLSSGESIWWGEINTMSSVSLRNSVLESSYKGVLIACMVSQNAS